MSSGLRYWAYVLHSQLATLLELSYYSVGLQVRPQIVISSLGGEVYAFSGMLGHMSRFREFFGHFLDSYPGTGGLEDCERLFTYLRSEKVVAEKFLAPHFLDIQQSIELKELGNAYWIPGSGNPADR